MLPFTDNRAWRVPAIVTPRGVSDVHLIVTDGENANLHAQGINVLRQFIISGDVIWGARGSQEQTGLPGTYLPIRRLKIYLENSLSDGTQWVVFEPNNTTLWGQIRLSVGSFLQSLSQKGAFQGSTPLQVHFLNCSQNIPPSSGNTGLVHLQLGFVPLVAINATAGKSPPPRHKRARLLGLEVRRPGH